MITHVAAAILYVTDQDESLAFYQGVLGFEVITDADMGGGARWLEVRPAGAQTAIVLLAAATFSRSPGEGANLTFASSNVATTIEILRSRGAEVSEPVEEPWGTYATVVGPDDDRVQFNERHKHV